ncbi:hypothetical protein WG66_011681, partial [Moniliophthora roreri]
PSESIELVYIDNLESDIQLPVGVNRQTGSCRIQATTEFKPDCVATPTQWTEKMGFSILELEKFGIEGLSYCLDTINVPKGLYQFLLPHHRMQCMAFALAELCSSRHDTQIKGQEERRFRRGEALFIAESHCQSSATSDTLHSIEIRLS